MADRALPRDHKVLGLDVRTFWNSQMATGRREQTTRSAYSLLEVLLASTICASALVPALTVLRDGLAAAQTTDRRQMLLIYGVQKMEEQLAVVAATWAAGSASGNFASDGNASFRYTVSRSDSAGSGGISNRLMNVTVTTFYDSNANSSLDSGEPSTVFTTKVSKLATYESKASS